MINKIKQEKAITLIALVVTIIVLLILAGISISMLTGENGILNRASEAKESTETAQTEELVKLSIIDAISRGLGSLTDANLKTALDNNIGAGKYEISGNETNGWIVKVNGKEYKIDSTGKIGETTPGENIGALPTGKGTTPYLPDKTKFEQVDGTDLDSGLVIKEKATGSEYVWVEVPRTAAVYPTAGVDISSFTDEEYTKIETDLHTYTNDYRNGTSYSDVYYADSTTGWFTNADEYNELKKNMLKSVYQNGGFWVGRYEAGIEDEANIRKAKTDTVTLTPITKQNMYPYNYVTRTQAKVLAEQVESGSYTSSLMFGVQWDLVLKYIETKNATAKSNLISDSTRIGNYFNNLWNITNANAKYSTDSGSSFTACPKPKTENAIILLTTGADTSFSLMNIYDIAGNVCEWTLEKASNDSTPCAGRGGTCGHSGSSGPASDRLSNVTLYSNVGVGFRLSLY